MPVEGFFEKLMRSDQLTLKDGYVEELGVRMAFLPTYTIALIFKEIYDEMGDEAFDLMFDAGYGHGKHIIESVGEENEMPKKQFLRQFAESANALGLGKVKMESDSSKKGFFSFKVEKSPFVEELSNIEDFEGVDRPVDEFWRGIGHGMAEEIFESSVESKETHCQFIGDQKCRFAYRAKEE